MTKKQKLSDLAKGSEVPDFVVRGTAKLHGWGDATELTPEEFAAGVNTFADSAAPSRPGQKGKADGSP